MKEHKLIAGVRFSGENVIVSVFEQLTSLDLQGQTMGSRSEKYVEEMECQTTMTLDDFLLGRVYEIAPVMAVRRNQHEIEKDRRKCTTLKVACLPARIKARSQTAPLEKRIRHYNSLLCMDFPGPDELDRIKEILRELPFVYYAGVSCGGSGVFAIIPIDNADWRRHEDYFDAVTELARTLGLNPARTGRNVTDLRYQSHDDNYILNRHCIRFSLERKCSDGKENTEEQ